jgi:glycosyltransferase involved in cell wall biosynthesis
VTAGAAAPLVSIGLPVHNGEQYLAEALDSILGQTVDDIEIVISDNASTDRTAAICETYANQDSRIRYHRQASNIGAAPNFNFVFDKATGQYFKWAAHDDICALTFLERCVAALEEHPDCVAAYTRHHTIDDAGHRIGEGGGTPQLGSIDPALRIAAALESGGPKVPPWAIFGVIRRSVLDRTQLHGSYTGSDRTLVVELALQGPLYEIDERLFLNRDHADRSIRIAENVGGKGHVRATWFDPSRAGKIVLPNWKRLFALTTAIATVPLPMGSRIRCFGVLGSWVVHGNWKRLVRDLLLAAQMTLNRSRRPAIESD